MKARKQEKVLKGIQRSTEIGDGPSVKRKPNDECYTSMQDILNEMSYWANLGKFKGKNIICPCDWDICPEDDIYSIRITYNKNDVEVIGNDVEVELGLFDERNESTIIKLEECEIDNFLKDKLVCNFVRTFAQQARNWGIKSITASGYNPEKERGIMFQDIDYSKYDICCTNPPFSLYRKFLNCIIGKIDFICLAPFLNRVNPSVGLPLMLQEAYLGFNAGIDVEFHNPTAENAYLKKIVAVDWITSFNEAQEERNENLKNHKTGINYEDYKDEYLVMENMTMKDGTHPIKVPGVGIPDNYNGWMFAPISCLTRIALSEFEWCGTNFHKYFNSMNPEANPLNHKMFNKMVIVNGKQGFHGILLRRK